jgi:pilus assembly protein Flp/PilA
MERGMIAYIKNLVNLSRDEKGQDLAEYALLIGLIALILIVAVTILGQEISTIFSTIANNIAGWDIG